MTAATWTTPADLRRRLQKRWRRGDFLTGAVAFPLRLPLKGPTAAAVTGRFEAVRAWVRDWQAQEGRLELEWRSVRAAIGSQRLPAAVVFADRARLLRFLGRQAAQDARRFEVLEAETLERFPELADWLQRHPLTVLKKAAHWDKVLAVLDWFKDHPRSGLYLRQLDIPGVDTKFIESRRKLFADLLDRVLPPEAIDATQRGAAGFEARYGLRPKPVLIRFRLLDPGLYLHGLTDLSVPLAEFARLEPQAERLFVTENEVNFLAFPPVARGLVIFGRGFNVSVLGEIGWLQQRDIHYWGDIDTHGFAILSRLRAHLPRVHSLLMDRATLLVHRHAWVEEPSPTAADLSRLTPEERALYGDLRRDRLGERVRLEQERVGYGWVRRYLEAL
ncbi:hypothetical protein MIT9_P0828 [Methylomarinovum caldicuralii]|uniref:DUF3322 and DUF2220 domain-containing protein n=1 Tax=Methylomarinovum caldicuralii TaxID=438856 RepID=A0AAU9BY91_9GAMM|nr:Wadjet anti-phage system protein JetD domain-containing protein [Methylomarinovum caldicuralii]BCX81250.1 hypothetical protein MIT9_P0828 [Methylomarinovum caldicuralii]